jgi:hypothetical protein
MGWVFPSEAWDLGRIPTRESQVPCPIRFSQWDMFPRVWEPGTQDIPGDLRENSQDFPDIIIEI